jgi:hypothetical protein
MSMPESGVNQRTRQASPHAGHVAVAAGWTVSNRPAQALQRSITGLAVPTFAWCDV